MMVAAVMERVQVTTSQITKPVVSACGALCHSKFEGDKARLNECLDNCKAASAIALVAEKLHRELAETIIEVIWSGGDIDPLPFEQSVRERFSRPIER